MKARIGDRLLVAGGHDRVGLIIGVPSKDGSPPYVIKWLRDGHIAMVYPDQYARIVPAGHPVGSGRTATAAELTAGQRNGCRAELVAGYGPGPPAERRAGNGSEEGSSL